MKPDDDKTRLIRRTKIYQDPKKGVSKAIPAKSSDESQDKTRILSRESLSGSLPNQATDKDKTKLVRRKSAGNAAVKRHHDDPVTGWLVVVAGPGRGAQVAIGEQDNHIGRGGGSGDPRVVIDFGDDGLSRDNAFVIRYDPKNRKFKIILGGGKNIIYHNGKDLDAPAELCHGDLIEVSQTTLRFVAFCGADFDWAES